jgi:hypothetical protein
MGEYSEAFVAFDVAKRKHAVAIAEGGRRGEVRFLGEIENSPATVELADRYDRLRVCFAPALIPKRAGERVTHQSIIKETD